MAPDRKFGIRQSFIASALVALMQEESFILLICLEKRKRLIHPWTSLKFHSGVAVLPT